jgi:hypothetical protein
MAAAFDRLLTGESPGQVCPVGCSCRGADTGEQPTLATSAKIAPTVATTDDAYAEQLAETVEALRSWKRLGSRPERFG